MNTQASTPFLPEKQHLEAKYTPWLGISLLSLGLLNVVLAVWAMLLSAEFSSAIIIGLIVTGLGILYLTRTYFVVAPNRITLYSLIGSVVKRYVYASPDEIRLENNKIYIKATGGDPSKSASTQKVRIYRWMTKADDWRRLEAMFLNR